MEIGPGREPMERPGRFPAAFGRRRAAKRMQGMSVSHLTVVQPPEGASPAGRLYERIRLLQVEARVLAQDHMSQLTEAMAEVSRLAGEVADGGEAFPVGARELCRRLSEEITAQSATLNAIAERSAQT